jgi:hypothetical protein
MVITTVTVFTRFTSLLFPLIVLALPATDSAYNNDRSQTPLVSDALTEILARGAPILGMSASNSHFSTDAFLQVSTMAAQNRAILATGWPRSPTTLCWCT